MSEYKESAFYWHEALDRSHLAVSFFEDYVMTHPAIDNNHDLKEIGDKVIKMMEDFYQAVGYYSNEFNKTKECDYDRL